MRKKLALLVVGALAAAGVTFGVAAPAQAATLGGVSVWDACVYQHGTPSSLAISPYNVYGWECVYNGGWNAVTYGVNMSQECAREYPNRGASAWYSNYNDPYSWYCYN